MCNEGELLEKFNIQLSPIPIPELTAQMKKVKEEGTEVSKVIKYCKDNMCIKIKGAGTGECSGIKSSHENSGREIWL